MSYQSSSPSPFCKVCRDAGCSEKEYTSHFVKSRGEVICPTLLNQACRICKVNGHTSSYCPDRHQREEPRRDDYRREEPRRDDYRRDDYRRDDYRREEPRRDDYRREELRREEPRRDDYRREELRRDDYRRDDYRRDDYRRDDYRREEPRLEEPRRQEEPRLEEPRRERANHGPRVRINLEAPALCAFKHAKPPVLTVNLHEATLWSDEPNEPFIEPFFCDPQQMCQEFIDNLEHN